MLKKRLLSAALVLAFALLVAAPEALACHRRRGQYRAAASRSYYDPYYAPRDRAVAGRTYYDPYYGQRHRNGLGSTGRAILTVAGPAAVGAGVGALAGGKRGAAVGALVGGGGGALYYLIKHRGRR